MYSVLFFLCFGSSSKVLRGLGDDHPIFLSTHSKKGPSEKWGQFGQERNCPSDRACNDTNAALGKCKDEGLLCNCMTEDYMYYSDRNQFEDDFEAQKETKEIELKEPRLLTKKALIKAEAKMCRAECLNFTEFDCMWWVLKHKDHTCTVWNVRPNRFKKTECDVNDPVNNDDCRMAGPPCR